MPPPSRLLPPRVVALACCRHKDLRGTCEKMSTRESCGAQVLAAPEAACTSKLVSTQLQRPACGDIVVTAGGSSSRAEMSACRRDRGVAQHGAPLHMCVGRARLRREGSDSKAQLQNEISWCSGAADTTRISVAGEGYFTAVCCRMSGRRAVESAVFY